MLRLLSLVLLQSLLCVSGCAYSLNPMATDDIVVGDPDLSGTWEIEYPPGGSGVGYFKTGVFEKVSKESRGTYRFTAKEGDREHVWLANLVKLDDNLYLELLPRESEVTNKLCMSAMLPLYSVYRVTVDGDALIFTFCSDQGFVDAAKEEGLEFIICRRDGRVILTAKTSELQDFYRKHGDWIFDEKRYLRYRRKQTTAEPE